MTVFFDPNTTSAADFRSLAEYDKRYPEDISIVDAPGYPGKKAIKIVSQPGHYAYSDDTQSAIPRNRVEIRYMAAQGFTPKEGEESWEFSEFMMLPGSQPGEAWHLTQLSNGDDYTWHGPAMTWDGLSGLRMQTTSFLPAASVEFEKWYRVLVYRKWSSGTGGQVVVYLDGVEKLRLSGANMRSSGEYEQKFGVYKYEVAGQKATVLHRGLAIGRTREAVENYGA